MPALIPIGIAVIVICTIWLLVDAARDVLDRRKRKRERQRVRLAVAAGCTTVNEGRERLRSMGGACGDVARPGHRHGKAGGR